MENGFGDHGEIALEEQVIDADDGTGKRVFHWSEENVRSAIRDGGEGGIEGGARNSRDGIAEKLDGGGFAEGAGFALESYTGGFKRGDQLAAPDGKARRLKPTLHAATRADFSSVAEFCLPELPANAASVFGFVAALANLEIRAPGSIIQHMMPKRAAVTRPQSDEYAPYYETYVSLIPGDDIVGVLETQRVQMAQLLAARSEREGNFRYAPDKWSVKEVIGHICDAERIFAYRLLRVARGDQTPLVSFEQNDYIAPGAFGDRTLADLAAEFAAVRAATMALVQSLKAEAWVRIGSASEKTVSARALAYIIAGHEVHHRKILDEKYFPAIPRA